MRTAAVLTLVVLFPVSSSAADGVGEINQACAVGPGCFPGDTPGFPVNIAESGSYRLTGNLTPPNQSTVVINVLASARGASIDLGGFTIRGSNFFTRGIGCTAPGLGIAVNTSAPGVRVTNGYIRGMGDAGLFLVGSNSRVEGVTAADNCGIGVQVGTASLVIDSVARSNEDDGIRARQGSRVANSVATFNGQEGIDGGFGSVLIDGCTAAGNGVDGIFVGERSLVRGSHTRGNGDDGIAALGDGSQILESSGVANADRGITLNGNIGVGFSVASGNTGLNLSGGVVLGCNLIAGAAVCPP